MAAVSKKSIKDILEKIDESFFIKDYSEKIKILEQIEKQANTINGEEVTGIEAIKIAYEKIKYYVSRIYGEGKAKSTLDTCRKSMVFIEDEIDNAKNQNVFQNQINMLKECITYLDISLNLEISFPTCLLDLYGQSLEKGKVNFTDIQAKYQRKKR